MENINKLGESGDDSKERKDERITKGGARRGWWRKRRRRRPGQSAGFKYCFSGKMDAAAFACCDQWLSAFLAFVYLIHYRRPSEPAMWTRARPRKMWRGRMHVAGAHPPNTSTSTRPRLTCCNTCTLLLMRTLAIVDRGRQQIFFFLPSESYYKQATTKNSSAGLVESNY